MTDHLSMVMIGWFFFLLIGVWVLVNALIDLTSKQIRRWFSEHWSVDSRSFQRLTNRHRISR
jgi:hypothetical protein